MPSDDEWKSQIELASTQRSRAIRATEYRRSPLGSFAAPPLIACEDGEEYWVKHMYKSDGCYPTSRSFQTGGMITDHIVAFFAGKIVDDVVPPGRLIDLTELALVEERLSQACPSVAHGSRNASKNCTGSSSFIEGGHNGLAINRKRVAGIAVLYGLALAADHQVIYRLDGDPLVYSVDHGHFFPGGPTWTEIGLNGALQASVDSVVVRDCSISPEELIEPMNRLRNIKTSDIAQAVAAPPDDWFFPQSDRIAVARYLWSRRDTLLEGF